MGCTNVSGPHQLNVIAGATYYFQVGNTFFFGPSQAVATITNGRDAQPADNTAIGAPKKVNP
jgi:hypothetical protein